MAHTHSVLFYHIVFSTKHREQWLDPASRELLFPYMAGIVSNFGGTPILINGVSDHVHMLLRLRTTPDVAEVVKSIKGSSSKWFHDQTRRQAFAWQEGYGAFTVSFSQKNRVCQYIADQEQRHRRVPFAEEYEALLKKHHVEYDARFFLD